MNHDEICMNRGDTANMSLHFQSSQKYVSGAVKFSINLYLLKLPIQINAKGNHNKKQHIKY